MNLILITNIIDNSLWFSAPATSLTHVSTVELLWKRMCQLLFVCFGFMICLNIIFYLSFWSLSPNHFSALLSKRLLRVHVDESLIILNELWINVQITFLWYTFKLWKVTLNPLGVPGSTSVTFQLNVSMDVLQDFLVFYLMRIFTNIVCDCPYKP